MGAVCQIEGANCPADKDCGDEVLIPAGTFWMGCNEAVDTQCYSDEKPYHEVYLDAYYIDRTEVTAAAYEVCVTAGGCTAPGSGSYSTYQKPGMEDHPINRVTWFQAEAYCAWAGKRLPTEAEWEKAARGTDGRKYPWGNATATCDLAVMSACPGDTQPVCSVSPAGDSPYGLCDMAGNVWEWVADWYSSSYYSSSPGSNPAGPASGSSRVVRGGRFGNDDVTLSVSIRYDDNPSAYYYFLGFRCGRDAP
jgi:formylglycine-generating enzyme required for sulfatase activity